MGNQPSQPAMSNSKAGIWAVIVLIILVLAGSGYYFLSQNDTNTYAANSTNTAVNTVLNADENANVVANGNTNETANENQNIDMNANSTVETYERNTYENSEYSLSISYPSDWQIFEQDKFCTKIPTTDCTNELVSFATPADSRSRMAINYLGNNPDGLSVNQWHRDVEGRSFDLDNEVPMGDFTGYSSEPIDSSQYHSIVTIYFALGDRIFDVYWYDQEVYDETGYSALLDTLEHFSRI